MAEFDSHAPLAWDFPVPTEIWKSADQDSAEAARQIVFQRRTWRRNFAGHPFLIAAQENQVAEIMEKAQSWALEQGFNPPLRLHEAHPDLLGLWRERTLLPGFPITFPQVRAYKALVFGPKGHASNLVTRLGEVDHLQVLQWQPGWDFTAETAALSQSLGDFSVPESMIEPTSMHASLFAHSTTYGFLTSDPGWAGPALQIEALVHIPALTAHRRIAQVHEGLMALGLLFHPEPMGQVNGLDAGFFRVSSRGGLTLSSAQCYQRFQHALQPLLQWERRTREAWWKKDAVFLMDRIRRSHHMLSEARLLPFHEALGFLSFIRLGAALGEIAPEWLGPAEKVRLFGQAFHLINSPLQGKDSFEKRGTSHFEATDKDQQQRQREQDIQRADLTRLLWTLPT